MIYSKHSQSDTFLALKTCVTKGKCVTLGMSVRFRDIPQVTHVCCFISDRQIELGSCVVGFVLNPMLHEIIFHLQNSAYDMIIIKQMTQTNLLKLIRLNEEE